MCDVKLIMLPCMISMHFLCLDCARTFQIESDEEILVLRETVTGMERKIQELQYQYGKLQLEYSAALLGETRNNLEGPSIFLIGGHNGITWLPSLDSFYPTTDRLVPLRPMSSVRSYAAVAALNDNLFVFGGGDGSSWYNTGKHCSALQIKIFVEVQGV